MSAAQMRRALRRDHGRVAEWYDAMLAKGYDRAALYQLYSEWFGVSRKRLDEIVQRGKRENQNATDTGQ